MENTITKDSRISIAASYFSIFAFEALKKELQDIAELRFIFTSPTFISEKAAKEKREFYIPRLGRERSLYGTEFEVKLRNELSQRAIAKECAEWIKSKVRFKSNTTTSTIPNFLHIDAENKFVYQPLNSFTTTNLGCEKGDELCNPVNRMPAPISENYLKIFNELWNDKAKMQDVTEEVIRNITEVYKENSPEFIYYVTLYNIFNEFLQDISEDVLPNEATGFKESIIWRKLYNFQQDAVLAIINKLEKYNGCILADSVGLGKTFTALATIKYYESRNKSVLVLCPKKLNDNWITYRSNLLNNPLAGDRLRYDVLYHTDLSRTSGYSNGLPLDRINWANYDLVVIDESHNFRNGGQSEVDDDQSMNRYQKLMNKVIRSGVRTKVLMLSATPVNNRFNDLKNQLELAYEGKSSQINKLLNTQKGIDDIFRLAQAAFNKWSKFPPEERNTDTLLKMLDFDFFEVLDSVTIARSRRHIEKYYNTEAIGKFPTRLKPISQRPPFTKKEGALSYNEIYDTLIGLNLSIYTPSEFIHDSAKNKYFDDDDFGTGLSTGREKGICKLMSTNLLKRLESSVYSFRLTTRRIKALIDSTIEKIDNHSANVELIDLSEVESEFEMDDQNTDLFSVGKRVKIELSDMNYLSWREELLSDSQSLAALLLFMDEIRPEDDEKLQTLLEVVKKKISSPLNPDNRKIIIFSAFSDTAEYLYQHVSQVVKEQFGLNSALITGSIDGRTTCPKLRTDLNSVLTCFSPRSKEKHLLMPESKDEIDILIATDCISEGQNLQDCDYLINYDIHWNPVRIIQRFGRIDRIGSKNDVIQLVNFWPDMNLDDYINLKSRVETRMRISVMTSTGDDDLINEGEKGALEYRSKQLKRLQEEVVDLEDMNDGISIMDLGLNEFRLDLLEYIKEHGDIDKVPFGMHAIVEAKDGLKPGVVYVLKNINKGVNIDSQNRLHPFYLVYISDEQEVICNHLQPKKMLDIVRLMCKGVGEPNANLCRKFNTETKDGRSMGRYSELLGKAISSIVSVKEDSELDSFFTSAETAALGSKISGLNDFELICFIVVK
ncbi:DEAD/DEAH box helicase-like protein [Mucinivorans hirudinis]|uniref:DEAD/DEAH box helicase-like protein n=1 Tax=Mucinivorans hirudinis TaxID=1433126 RepID=A0A060RAG2_9BACT|nr:DEAD/DEAH box helicase-like protein [Mucinivorans hirudinis]